MKEITLDDCKELVEKFNHYTKTIEQPQFAAFAIIQTRLALTLEHYAQIGKIDNQKEANAMFRVVLKMIGEDASAYEEGATA